jgi:hypothetical protein
MEFWASFLSGVIAGLIFITLHYAMLWFKGQSLKETSHYDFWFLF